MRNDLRGRARALLFFGAMVAGTATAGVGCGRTDLIDEGFDAGSGIDASIDANVGPPDAALDAESDAAFDAAPPPDAATCKICNAQCVSGGDPVTGCDSPSCAPCALAHTIADCSSKGTCAIETCESGWADCDGIVGNGCETNVNTSPTSCGRCGTACVGQSVCNAGICSADCGTLTNCGGACVNEATDPAHCGDCARACPAPTSGVATCAGGVCGATCDKGYNLCNEKCFDGKSPLACGPACTACPIPPNGTATCDGTSCGIACGSGFHVCGAACADNTSIASCGASCTACPAPGSGSGTATCDGAACGVKCAPGYSACSAGCCACGDVTSDPHNCGDCGHDCRGATCAGSVCQPVIIATQQADASVIAVDETSVYWASNGPTSSVLWKAPVSGGAAVALTTGNIGYVYALEIDAKNVYFSTSSLGGTSVSGAVQSIPLAGGVPATLVANLQYPKGLAVDSAHLYFTVSSTTTSPGTVSSASLTGGASTAIASNQRFAELETQQAIAVNAAGVYWLGATDLEWSSFASPGAKSFAANEYPTTVIADAANVYWGSELDNGDVFQKSVRGGGIIQIAANQQYVSAIAVDATWVYWTVGEGGTGAVSRSRIGGGAVVPLATGQAYPIGIAVNSSRVFWVNFGDGTINSVPK